MHRPSSVQTCNVTPILVHVKGRRVHAPALLRRRWLAPVRIRRVAIPKSRGLAPGVAYCVSLRRSCTAFPGAISSRHSRAGGETVSMTGHDEDYSSDGGDSCDTMRCPHGLELCGACCVDYTEINEIARDSAASSGAQQQLEIKNHVPLGTRCKLIDRSGRTPPQDLLGKVVGSRMAVDDVMDESVPHYVIESEVDGERFNHRIDDFHEEWLVWRDGNWEKPVPLNT